MKKHLFCIGKEIQAKNVTWIAYSIAIGVKCKYDTKTSGILQTCL